MSRGPVVQELRVLEVLQASRGAVVSRAELFDALYPEGTDAPASGWRHCHTIISRLRRRGVKIQTVRGVGHVLGGDAVVATAAIAARPTRQEAAPRRRSSWVEPRPPAKLTDVHIDLIRVLARSGAPIKTIVRNLRHWRHVEAQQ